MVATQETGSLKRTFEGQRGVRKGLFQFPAAESPLSILAFLGSSICPLLCPSRAALVPIFSFGENNLFNQVENTPGTWLRWIQNRLQKIMGISLPLFHGRGVFQYSFGIMPFRQPITTIGEQRSRLGRAGPGTGPELDGTRELEDGQEMLPSSRGSQSRQVCTPHTDNPTGRQSWVRAEQTQKYRCLSTYSQGGVLMVE